MATFTPTNQDGVWLVESVALVIVAPRGRPYLWVAPRDVRQGTPNHLRAYVRSLPTYAWMPGLPISLYRLSAMASSVGPSVTATLPTRSPAAAP